MNSIMAINKKVSKTWRLCVLQVLYFLLKFLGKVFISSSYDFINSSQIIAESSIILPNFFSFSQIHVLRFHTYSFSHTWCSLHSHWHLSLFHHRFYLHFVWSNFHLHSHEICFVNVLDSFIPVMRLKALRFKSFVWFETHALLD